MSQISIIKKSELEGATRIDPEYYKKEYLEKDQILKNANSKRLMDISNSIINFGAYSLCSQIEYKKSGVPFLQVGNIKENFITEKFKYIDEELSKTILHKSLVKENQVLITIAGTIGNAVVAQSLPENTNSNQAIANITLSKEINPFYISTFLNCKYGKYQSQRLIISNVQPNLLLVQVKSIKIPILPQSFQLQIEKNVKSAYEKQTRSKQLYKEAEEMLLKEVDLLDYKPEHILSFQTTKKETDEAGRFDAEYFQPKYEEIIKKIEKYRGGFDVVKNILNFNKKNFFPKEDELYNYIPLSRVSNSGEIEIPEKELGKDLPTRARRKVKKGEVILSSISGSLKTSAIIGEEHENYIVSNGFYVFSSNKINSETLLVLFKSQIMIELLQRISKGAILGGYDLTAFEKFKIPLIKPQIQKQIAKKITESHKLRKESKELLEEAKRKVEEEIKKRARE